MATRTITTIPRKYFLSNNSVGINFPIEQTYSSIISFVPLQSKRPQSCIINAFDEGCTEHKGETHKAAGKTLRNYPPVFFQAPKTYKGWTRGTSPTRCTPRGGGKRGMSTREKPDKLIEKARRLEETLPRKQPFNLNSIICQPLLSYHRSKILCNTDGWNDIRDWNWFQPL